MIVKNEESCLETCLNSVKDVDEIVIVDTGSTDRTIEIAKKFTDKVHSGEEYLWRDDFSFSRNQSLEKCTGDWILIIDADEILEKDGVVKIRQFIENTSSNSAHFDTISESNVSHIHKSIRLFRRNPDIYWKGKIHNYLSISEGEKVPISIIYGRSLAHKNDPDRALRILSKVVTEEATCIREKFYLAREYWYRKEYEKAIIQYKEYLKVGVWGPEIAEAWLMKARCYWHLKRGEQARLACLQAIKVNANFSEAFLFMAEMSGPKNAKRWKEIAATASDEGVLFIRKQKLVVDNYEKQAGVYRPHSDKYLGKFICGDRCIFGENIRIDCTGDVTVGSNCIFGRDVKIHTHKHSLYYGLIPDVTKENGVTPINLRIGTNVVLAENVTILPGVFDIGDNSIVGNSSVLTHSVGINEIWAGNPARLIGRRTEVL